METSTPVQTMQTFDPHHRIPIRCPGREPHSFCKKTPACTPAVEFVLQKKTIALPFPQRLATLPCRSPSAAAPTGLNSTAPLPVALRRTESNSSRGGWRHRPWTAVARSSRRLQVQRRLPSTAAPLELRRSSCRLQVRRLPPTAAPVELRRPKSVTLRRLLRESSAPLC